MGNSVRVMVNEMTVMVKEIVGIQVRVVAAQVHLVQNTMRGQEKDVQMSVEMILQSPIRDNLPVSPICQWEQAFFLLETRAFVQRVAHQSHSQ